MRCVHFAIWGIVAGFLVGCVSAKVKPANEYETAKHILTDYFQKHQGTDGTVREPASTMAQNRYALLSSDESFNTLLDAQATEHYHPILFAQNTETKMDCNCWQYALFFRNDQTKQIRLSMVVFERVEDTTRLKSLGAISNVPDEDIGAQNKNLAAMTEFVTSD